MYYVLSMDPPPSSSFTPFLFFEEKPPPLLLSLSSLYPPLLSFFLLALLSFSQDIRMKDSQWVAAPLRYVIMARPFSVCPLVFQSVFFCSLHKLFFLPLKPNGHLELACCTCAHLFSPLRAPSKMVLSALPGAVLPQPSNY